MKKIELLVSLAFITLVSAQKECSSTVYKYLGNLAKRSPTYFQDSVSLCDRYLVKGWYVAFHHDMPTSPPSLTACGTTYPNWLNDTLPETKGASKAVKICEVGFASDCSRNHFVQVTNCGAFLVYELTPLDLCSSAYCFQADKACVTDAPSNAVVAYHGVTWQTNITGVKAVHDPDVNLVCKFDRLPNQSLYYDVTWYVDDTEVLTNQTVSSNSSDLALLTGSQMLAKGKKANSMIHCMVGAKISETDIPCKRSTSSLFYAGIKVLTSTLRIQRGEHENVTLQFTIPFVSQHGIINITGKLIENQPELYISLSVRGRSVDCNDPNNRYGDTKVSAFKKQEADRYATEDWKIIHNITVYNKDDGDFTLIDKHITLRLETGATNGVGSKIFENLILPDIQVYIEDKNSSWKSVSCESHTDPHMKTFDGVPYECQLEGIFVLYRNTHFEQEVQEKHHKCHPAVPYPQCSCAVAVRSGKYVFIIDFCNSKTIIHFPSCGDGVLKVIKIKDKYYKVIMPTGTLVDIKFISWPTKDDWQLNIDIFPSPSDVGKSSGLCGILDGNKTNDFTRRDGKEDNPIYYNFENPPNLFSNHGALMPVIPICLMTVIMKI